MKHLCVVLALSVVALTQTAVPFNDGTDDQEEFKKIQILSNGQPASNEVAVAMTVPQSDQHFQVNVGAFFARTYSPKSNVVGFYGQVVCAFAGSKCWGGNTVVYSEKNAPSSLVSMEVDVNANNKNDFAVGMWYTGGSTVMPDNSIAELFYPMGSLDGIPWNYGIVFAPGAVKKPITIYPSSNDDTAPSGTINLIARNKGQLVQIVLYADSDGTLVVSAPVKVKGGFPKGHN